jgi:hypothetical protein
MPSRKPRKKIAVDAIGKLGGTPKKSTPQGRALP